ncbi:MAG: hotdog fold thioesterase [Betaproteobacteria bacterium]|nr:hotdog fold thioesterase [Betaproteobacteria bacterium]
MTRPPDALAPDFAVTPDTARRSGREILEAIVSGELPQAGMGATNSFRLVEVGDGFVAFEGDPGPHLLNIIGSVHGGWALTLLDSACGAACFSALKAGLGHTTIELKANLCRPISVDTGTVRAEGRVVSHGRRIMTSEGRLTGPDGKLLAHGTSTIFVIRPEDR